MKTHVLGLDAVAGHALELPAVFDTEVDPVLIKRAVLSSESKQKQRKGIFLKAGINNTSDYGGYRGMPASERTINIGHSRLPRMRNRRSLAQGRVAKVPQAIGGRRAHPPKVEHVTAESINKKERQKALACAIAATGQKEWVLRRNPKSTANVPIVVSSQIEQLSKTAEVSAVLEKLNLLSFVASAKKKRTIRPGRSKARLGKYKRRKSLLIVTGEKSALNRAGRNLEGVDVVDVRNLSVELLAPGTQPGRLTLWTESAVSKIVHKGGNLQ